MPAAGLGFWTGFDEGLDRWPPEMSELIGRVGLPAFVGLKRDESGLKGEVWFPFFFGVEFGNSIWEALWDGFCSNDRHDL